MNAFIRSVALFQSEQTRSGSGKKTFLLDVENKSREEIEVVYRCHVRFGQKCQVDVIDHMYKML